ncbi:MAG: spore germination protein [Syntrophomonadaceae bacterium]|nr:spore germination protein [Syntrophomonadaceae bacterium]
MDSKITGDLNNDEQYLINTIGQGMDTCYRHLVIPALDNCGAMIVYIKGLVNTTELEDAIIAPLVAKMRSARGRNQYNKTDKVEMLIDAGMSVSGVQSTQKWNEICDAIVSGDSVLFIEQCNAALILANRGWKARSIAEPTSEVETKGPKDSFVEDIMPNMALIRRRIRDYSLRFEGFKIGDRTKTDIALVYIESLVNDSLLTEVRERLNKIKTDSILASNYIEEFIEDGSFSMFPKIEHTERPDKAAAAILEGRIAILVDNTPFTLIVPAVFWNFLEVPGDHYERFYVGTFWRWIRLLAIFLTLSSTSTYVLLTSFHQEMLPTSLAIKLTADRSGVPFPAVIEALFMEIIFEVMTEAGLRIPRALGQTVSIIGTLVIGQGAVLAGLVGPALVIAVAIGAISSFAIPSTSMSTSLRLLRFPLLILSATLGIFGFLGGIIAITLHIMSLRSFGTPFYAPISPIGKDSLKDTLYRAPRWKMTNRPDLARPKDKARQAADLRPQPDSQ